MNLMLIVCSECYTVVMFWCCRGDECPVGHSSACGHVTCCFRSWCVADNDANDRFQFGRK